MNISIKQTIAPLVAGVALALSLPLYALAYDDLRIEVYFDDGRIEVDVDYYENGREIEREYVFNTTDLDEAYKLTAEELDISVSEVEDAVVRIDRDDDDWDDDDDSDRERDESYYRDSSRSDASEAIRDAKEEIAEAERFVEKNQNSGSAAANLKRARTLLADAEEAYKDREYGRAERLGDEAEYLAEDIVRGRSMTGVNNQVQTATASGDREVLQRQLLALLQQLITLLQAQQR